MVNDELSHAHSAWAQVARARMARDGKCMVGVLCVCVWVGMDALWG